MKYLIVFFAVACTTKAVQVHKMTLAEPTPEPCRPVSHEDIASDDQLVDEMFHAYRVNVDITCKILGLCQNHFHIYIKPIQDFHMNAFYSRTAYLENIVFSCLCLSAY